MCEDCPPCRGWKNKARVGVCLYSALPLIRTLILLDGHRPPPTYDISRPSAQSARFSLPPHKEFPENFSQQATRKLPHERRDPQTRMKILLMHPFLDEQLLYAGESSSGDRWGDRIVVDEMRPEESFDRSI